MLVIGTTAVFVVNEVGDVVAAPALDPLRKDDDAFALPLLVCRLVVHLLRRRLETWPQSWLSAQYVPFELRPELGTEIPGEIEPELERALQHAQAHGI